MSKHIFQYIFQTLDLFDKLHLLIALFLAWGVISETELL